MIVISGYIKVKPEDIEKLRPAMRTVLETTRKEKGCILYAFGEDVLEPGLIRIVERWDSWETLEPHRQADHIKAWGAALRAVGGALGREVIAHQTSMEKAI